MRRVYFALALQFVVGSSFATADVDYGASVIIPERADTIVSFDSALAGSVHIHRPFVGHEVDGAKSASVLTRDQDEGYAQDLRIGPASDSVLSRRDLDLYRSLREDPSDNPSREMHSGSTPHEVRALQFDLGDPALHLVARQLEPRGEEAVEPLAGHLRLRAQRTPHRAA